MKNKTKLKIGISILLFLLISYFIKIPVDSGFNYKVNSPLLGILIFYQPAILAAYIILGMYFIWKGIGKKIALK